MAAIFIVAGLAIADKVEKKREAKKQQKKARDEARYRELQIETKRRLSRTQSGNVIENAVAGEQHREEGEEDGEDGDVEESLHYAVDEAEPPPYEDAVQAGERREREWAQVQQRRTSSAYSSQSHRSNHRSSTNFVRMG